MLRKRVYIHPSWAVLCIVLFSALVTLGMLALTPKPFEEVWDMARRSDYKMPLLNYLPVVSVMLLLFFATGSASLSITFAGGLFLIMAVVNRLKLQMRGDPLLHWDFSLFGEVLGIAGGLGAGLYALAAALVVVFFVAVILLTRLVRTRRMRAWARLFGLALTLLAMYTGNATLYSSQAVYDSLPVSGSFYNLADVHNCRGNLYCFLYNYNTHRTPAPADYDPAQVEAVLAAYDQAEVPALSEARPHVVIVIGEAFSGLSESPALDFTGYRDPLETFKRLGEEGLSASAVVPSRGGGTADTEFDVLTGGITRYLRGAPYSFRMVSGALDGLPSLLSGLGYQTFALHPGYRWFYNRQNVYRYLGFDTMVFEDSFAREAYLDAYISEEATFDMFLSLMEERRTQNPGTPIFGYCLTIQNHAAYLNRYLPEGEVNFTSSIPLSDTERNILSNYFAGAIDADEQLGRLAAYLESLDEPAILLYLGDHLPSLEESLYERLIPGADAAEGSLAYETRLYSVPLLIWQNAAAAEQTSIAGRMALRPLPEHGKLSSNYLGVYLLELLGLEGFSPYFAYASGMRETYPVIMESAAFLSDGTAVADDAAPPDLALLRSFNYFRMVEP